MKNHVMWLGNQIKNRSKKLWQSGKLAVTSQADQALAHSCAGRVVSALTFLVIIFCLSLWITAFILLRDHLFAETLSGNTLTDLTCIIFFGGLVTAIFIGALLGNFMRRTFWKLLVKRSIRK